MTVAQDINAFLTSRAPAAFCDDCIAEALSLSRRQQAALRTEALATTSDFTRVHGGCSNCGEEKLVICANKQK
jgi:hypothetical protein